MSFQTVEIKKRSGSQLIKIPFEMEIDDDKVYLKKVGNSLFIIPFHKPWDSFISSTDQFTDDFLEERKQPDQQEREPFE